MSGQPAQQPAPDPPAPPEPKPPGEPEPKPEKPPTAAELRAEARQERAFRIEVIKTIFSILATLGTVTAIYLSYAASDFKDARSSLDSVINRLTEASNGRPAFRQTSAAALLPHFYFYASAYGERPFQDEVKSLLSSYFVERSTQSKLGADGQEAASELLARAYPVDQGDLRQHPAALNLTQQRETLQRVLALDPLHRAMSEAASRIVQGDPGLLGPDSTLFRDGMLVQVKASGLPLRGGHLIQLGESSLKKARLTGRFWLANLTYLELDDSALDVDVAHFCSLFDVNIHDSTGTIGATAFSDWGLARVVRSTLRVDHLVNSDLSLADLRDSQLTGELWAHLDLTGACLLNTTLKVARLNDVNLSGALLASANLAEVGSATNVTWTGALVDEHTRPPRGLSLQDLEKSGARRLEPALLTQWLESNSHEEDTLEEVRRRLQAGKR